MLFAPFGPRLDRPTAVGDEGRGRATSLFVATLVASGALVALTTLFDTGAPASLAATGAGFTCAGVALLSRDEPLVRAGAPLLLVPGIVVATLAVGLPAAALVLGLLEALFESVGGSPGGILGSVSRPAAALGTSVAIEVAVFGGVATWADSVGDGKVTEGVTQAVLTDLVAAALAVPAVVLLVVVALADDLLVALVAPPMDRPDVVGLALVVGVVAASVGAALAYLPVVSVLPRRHRERADRVRSRLLGATVLVVLASGSGCVVLAVLALLGVTRTAYAAVPDAVLLALGLATGAVLRVPLLLLGGVALTVVLAGALVRRVAGDGREWIGTTGVPLVGGVVLLVVVTPAIVGAAIVLVGAVESPETLPVVLLLLGVAAAVAVGAFLLGVVGLATVPLAASVGLLPRRTMGPAMLAAGTVGVALFAGTAGASAVLVAGGVAAGLVAWDLGRYGVELTADLGHLPATTWLERRHAAQSLAIGSVGVGVAVGGTRVLAVDGGGLLPAAALAVLGVLVLAMPLRG